MIQPSSSSNHESVESVEEEELEDDDMKDVSTTDATTDATTNATTEADAVPSGAKADDVQSLPLKHHTNSTTRLITPLI